METFLMVLVASGVICLLYGLKQAQTKIGKFLDDRRSR